jgi:hypothetical protein
MPTLTIIKKNVYGQETWRYQGKMVAHTSEGVVLEALFDRADMSLQGLPLRRGDRFVETYYFNRWYNIYAIYSRSDGSLSGWYCNITPCRAGWQLFYEALALADLSPGWETGGTDDDEFTALPLSPDERQTARRAMAELQSRFENQQV